MYSIKSLSAIFVLLPMVLPIAALPAPIPAPSNGSCAPGHKFDMTLWKLQLPTGSTGKPDEIESAKLQGCDGYQDPKFFFLDGSGNLVMKVPGSPQSAGCVTTSGSKHCRTELREVNADGSKAAWDPKTSTNSLTVELTVVTPDDGSHGTAIGQVFGAAESKPIGEMYYSKTGDITIGVKPDAKSPQKITALGKVAVGTKFSYELAYQNSVLTATINGEKTTLDTGSWGDAKAYFKAGNYNQGDIPSEVIFHSIKIAH